MRIARIAVCCALLPAGAAFEPAYSPLTGIHDSGSFTLLLNEEPAATIWFRMDPDGAMHNHTILSIAGEHVTTVLRISAPTEHGVGVDVREYRARIPFESTLPDRGYRGWTWNLRLSPPLVFDSDYGPALLTSIVRAYDRRKGGAQSFPVYVLPGFTLSSERRRVTATLEWKRKSGEFDEYSYEIPAGRYKVLADGSSIIYRIRSENGRFELVREGQPLPTDSKQDFTIERSVPVSMRDGIKLATDIYRPTGPGRFPVILQRTPYKKEMLELQAKYYARRGYVFAAQDVRGRFASQGNWEPFVHEGDDGYDTVEWLATQSWSTGKVGMLGGSYDAAVQWYAASRRPPHLTTIIPSVSPPDPFLNVPYEFGTFRMAFALWWLDLLGRNATADLSGRTFDATLKDFDRLLRPLPVIALDEAVLGRPNLVWRKWIEHSTLDRYWSGAAFLDRLAPACLPVFHQSGWFDGNGIGTKLNYLKMTAHGHPHQKLVIGPWTHNGVSPFGQDGALDLQREHLRWFDYWLKGIDNGVGRESLVNLYVLGAKKWIRPDRYPLAETRWENWYLHTSGVSPATPSIDTPPRTYTYDPAQPTPAPQTFGQLDEPGSDRLVYLSAPFDVPMTVAGPLSAVLYASSSAKDTDWFVSLFDVQPDGRTMLLAQGKLRARYRKSLRKPELLRPGRVYPYHLDLWHTAVRFDKGHRLKIEVASASFPEFSRNLNTGGHNESETKYVVAEQKIYCSPEYPSHIVLPVIPETR